MMKYFLNSNNIDYLHSSFNNKIRLFESLNNYKECVVCHEENVLHINFNCGHEICKNCYLKMDKCYYNC